MKFKYEPILNRLLKVVGYEVLLSNPSDFSFDTISNYELNDLVKNQLEEILTLISNNRRYFYTVNVERRQLLNNDFYFKVIPLMNNIALLGGDVYFEITERDSEKLECDYLLLNIKNEYKLKFAADDVNFYGWLKKDLTLEPRYKEFESGCYDLIKLEFDHKLFEKFSENGLMLHEVVDLAFSKMLSFTNKYKGRFMLEKIETTSDLSQALIFPCFFYQGYLFSKNEFNMNQYEFKENIQLSLPA